MFRFRCKYFLWGRSEPLKDVLLDVLRLRVPDELLRWSPQEVPGIAAPRKTSTFGTSAFVSPPGGFATPRPPARAGCAGPPRLAAAAATSGGEGGAAPRSLPPGTTDV